MLKGLLLGITTGFSPCFVSVLLFLLMITINSKIKSTIYSFTFILGTFLSLFLFTAFSISLVSHTTTIKPFYIALNILGGLLAVIFAILNLSDWYHITHKNLKKVKLQSPHKWRSYLQMLIKKYTLYFNFMTIIVIFLLGMLTTSTILACSGSIFITFVLTQKEILIPALFFSIGAIIPALIVVLICVKTQKITSCSTFWANKIKYIKLLNAGIMIIFFIAFIWQLKTILN